MRLIPSVLPSQFKKGHKKVPGSGRPKGVLPKWKIPTVRELMFEHKIEPIKEVLDIYPTLAPMDKVKVMIALFPYCYKKVDQVQIGISAQIDISSNPYLNKPRAELYKVLSPPTNGTIQTSS